MKKILKTVGVITVFLTFMLAYTEAQAQLTSFEELDPQAENIEEVLKQLDQQYFQQTGQLPFLMPTFLEKDCRKFDCPVYVVVKKSEQKLYLYIKGALQAEWLVSTGAPKTETPIWEGHPNGRVYDAYSSKANPGGDYQGLGNMPYAVFLKGGYAIHGTIEANFKKLGSKASHGCVRVHPDHAKIFNRLVRQHGVAAVWVSIIE
jgi:hypothetical protein